MADVYASAKSSVAVVPNDNTDVDFNSLYVGTAGDVTIKHTADGAAVNYKNVPAGFNLNVYCRRVMATGTTASDITGMKW